VPKIVALDYGSKRVGVAISDPENKIAFALTTISTELVLKYIIDLVAAEKTSLVVIGFPVNLDGSLNEISNEINVFINKLNQKIPEIIIEKYDERFTSVIAKKTILNSGIGKQKRQNKSLVDKVSATIILQSYLDYLQR
jgi:putative Holliday junction resolvase